MSKVVIIVMLVAMIGALGVGLFYLLKTPNEQDKKNNVVKALTWRIGIWVVLLAFIVLAMKLGWIEPSNSVNPKNFNKEQQQRMEQEKPQ